MTVSVHTFVVQSGDATIVVDTCIGNDKERDSPRRVTAARTTRFIARIIPAVRKPAEYRIDF